MKPKYEVFTSEDLRTLAEGLADDAAGMVSDFITPRGRIRFRRAVARQTRLLYWAARRIDDHDRGMAYAHADHKRRGGDP